LIVDDVSVATMLADAEEAEAPLGAIVVARDIVAVPIPFAVPVDEEATPPPAIDEAEEVGAGPVDNVLPAAPRLAVDDVNVGPAVCEDDIPLAIVDEYCPPGDEDGAATELIVWDREVVLAMGRDIEDKREDTVPATTVVVVALRAELTEVPPAALEVEPAIEALLDPNTEEDNGEGVVIAAAVLLGSADMTVDESCAEVATNDDDDCCAGTVESEDDCARALGEVD
jgi:hypothetical protein